MRLIPPPSTRRVIYKCELAFWAVVGVPLAVTVLSESVRYLNFMSAYALVLALRIILDTPPAKE